MSYFIGIVDSKGPRIKFISDDNASINLAQASSHLGGVGNVYLSHVHNGYCVMYREGSHNVVFYQYDEETESGIAFTRDEILLAVQAFGFPLECFLRQSELPPFLNAETYLDMKGYHTEPITDLVKDETTISYKQVFDKESEVSMWVELNYIQTKELSDQHLSDYLWRRLEDCYSNMEELMYREDNRQKDQQYFSDRDVETKHWEDMAIHHERFAD